MKHPEHSSDQQEQVQNLEPNMDKILVGSVLDSLKWKVQYVSAHLPKNNIAQLEQVFLASLSPLHAELSPAQCQILFLDLLYLFSRHQKWIENPLFLHMSTHQLSKEHRLASSLVDCLIRFFFEAWELHETSLPRREEYQKEKSFLSYLVASTLAAKDEKVLRQDLGFGDDVLKMIQNASQSMLDLSSNPNDKTSLASLSSDESGFITGLEEQCATVLHEMAESYADKPWLADLLILMFDLYAVPEPWQGLDFQLLSETILRWFIYLGEHRPTKRAPLEQFLKKELQDWTTWVPSEEELNKLFLFLIKSDFIHEFPSGSRKGKPSIALTLKGYELTAQAFSVQYLLKECAGTLKTKFDAHVSLPAPWKKKLDDLSFSGK